ncbi:hypothetical protein [Phycicoccus sp. 3266]|uniref:hypothetical protein n=1 Tax=Phycicoccus sp. 3266 TaxID=2817751 RepID=UPI00285A67C2|nr:hypothetical protein [Phycicoccus sp. 3266]MDR6862693.1 hypothetical protein [Phycicoccus sp. 3266]
MDIELLVMPDCPNGAAAYELITTAVTDTPIKATITRTIITSQDQARQRRFTGCPTILPTGLDPFTCPDASVGLYSRLYASPNGPRSTPTPRDLALKRVATG